MRATSLFSIAILLSVFLFSAFNAENTTVELKDAIASQSISCEFAGNAKSPHYEKPLLLQLTNNKSEPVHVKIPNGQLFSPTDSSYQNLIVTDEIIIVLKPNEKLDFPVSAMCTEASDMGQNAETKYTLGKLASGNLLKATQFIEQNNLFNTIGAQHAVWSVTNEKPIESICDFNETNLRKLQEFVAKLLNKPLPPPPAPNDYVHNYNAPTKTIQVRFMGEFEFNFARVHSVKVAMFNKDNIVVRELYNNPAMPSGIHNLSYEFDASIYTDDYYYIRLTKDSEIVFDDKVEMR